MKGYIYILKRFGERFLKIGKTTKDPEIRAAELSAETGVSTPFIVIHAEEVSDINSCESEIHNALDEFRVSPRREFFDISVKEALNIMNNVFEKFKEESLVYTPFRMSLEHMKQNINLNLKQKMINFINQANKSVENNPYSQSFDQVMNTGVLQLIPDHQIKEEFREKFSESWKELINKIYNWDGDDEGVNFDVVLRTTLNTPQPEYFLVDPQRDTDITYFLKKKILNYPNLFLKISEKEITVDKLSKFKIRKLLSNNNLDNYGMFKVECPKMPRLFGDENYKKIVGLAIDDFHKLIQDFKSNKFNIINLMLMEMIMWD